MVDVLHFYWSVVGFYFSEWSVVGVLISIWSVVGGSWSVVCGRWLVGGRWFCTTPSHQCYDMQIKQRVHLPMKLCDQEVIWKTQLN